LGRRKEKAKGVPFVCERKRKVGAGEADVKFRWEEKRKSLRKKKKGQRKRQVDD